jgi:hypothetical protein
MWKCGNECADLEMCGPACRQAGVRMKSESPEVGKTGRRKNYGSLVFDARETTVVFFTHLTSLTHLPS